MGTWSERMSDSLRRARAASAATARGTATLPLPVPWRRRDTNPFSALEVQLALGRIEDEIAALQRNDGRFARGHHLVAARLAYDQLLDEACRLAGVPDVPDTPALRRIVAEAELRTRGWSW